jgi:hypothetical protein
MSATGKNHNAQIGPFDVRLSTVSSSSAADRCTGTASSNVDGQRGPLDNID